MLNNQKQRRILIVDDDELIRENLRLVLEAQGWEPFDATDGYRALEILYKYPIDIMLLDVNMPGLGGLEVLKMVRQAGYRVPVILMTGYPSIDLSVEALRNGATDFLVKPFTMEQLKNILENVMRREEKEQSEQKLTKPLVRLLKQKIREQTILFTISDRLTGCRSLSELYQEILNLALHFTSSHKGVLYLADLSRSVLLPTVWEGQEGTPPEFRLEYRDNPIVKASLENMPYLSCRDSRSFLVVPFSVRGEFLGSLVLERSKAFDQEDLFVCTLIVERASPLVENFILYESIFLNLHDSLRALVKALEAKDPYTKEHSERVTSLALELARFIGLSETEIESLRFAGHLHDIGKVGIQDHILLKPGKLTKDEYEVIKRHPLIGAEIVGHISLLKEEVLIIKHHHERWDGRGYPDLLQGEKIPFLARILAVADTYDAMTSERPYRPSLPHNVALEEIRRNAGLQFDPQVVEAFLDLWSQKQKGESFHGDYVSGVVA